MEPSNAASFPANDIDHVRLPTNVTATGHEPASPDLEKNPPLYENAINAATTDTPPTYDSLYNKLRRAKDESSNPVEYVSKACSIICGSVIITILFALSAALPVAMIVVGAVYINDCPINAKIPIWLVVTGAFGCLSSIIRTASNCYTFFKRRNDETYEMNKKSCLMSVIEMFLFAWFICGNIWVYSIRSIVSSDPANKFNYCNNTCYSFAFWLITVSWILIGVMCCCCCTILVVAGCGLSIAALFNKQ